jgi:protein-tyrosine-phosphatase
MTDRLPASVLFVCSENAVRSPMAEALAKRLYGARVYVDSAGVRSGDVDPFAVAALDEIGVDLHRHHSKSFEDLVDASLDVIVSLSPEAHHRALEFTRALACDVEYWPTPDPSAVDGDRERKLDAYRDTREHLLRRLKARFGGAGGPSV